MGDEVIDTRFGKFLINPRDCVGTTLKAGTLWDGPGFLQPIAHEYGRLGERGVSILDVGANLGAFTVWLCQQGAWRVVAVEPVPETLLYLKANLDLNQAVTGDAVILLEIAAYDQRCQMETRAFDPDNLGATALLPTVNGRIPGAPLDDFVHLYGEAVSLIKIDAQGCDGKALLGLRWTLAHFRPVVVFEWETDLAEVHGETLAKIVAWLKGQRYRVDPWPAQPNNYLARPV